VTSSTVGDITFELARHEFRRIFHILRDSRVADLVLGIPWQDDEQASLMFGTTRVFTLMDGTSVNTHAEDEHKPKYLLMSSCKIQKLMRKTCRSRGRNAEFYVIHIASATEKPAEFHIIEELAA
jgi:hypothetical protein